MSFTANTAFERRIPAVEYIVHANVAGLYQVSSADADCDAGQLCVRNGRVPCEGYAYTDNGSPVQPDNANTWYMNAATSSATANDVIYACDTHDNQLLPDGRGNQYYIGRQTLGLGAPAGRICNYQQIIFDGTRTYRFGAGNVTVNTTGDTFFTIDNGKLSSVTAEPTTAGTIYFELAGTGNFTEGASQSFGYYDVVAKTCVA